MRKYLNLLVVFNIFGLVVSCNTNFSNNSQSQNDTIIYKPENSKYLDKSFKVELNDTIDSTVLNNELYKIYIFPHEGEVGDLIGVYNKISKKTFSIDEGASYFVDVVDSFIIIDSGTSASRGLSIYNLNSLKIVFSGGYEGNLDIKNKTIIFKTVVQIPDSTKRPKCSEEFKNEESGHGYVEKQIFELKNLRLIKTGEYECCMFE